MIKYYYLSYDEKMMNIFLTAAHQYNDSYVLGKKIYVDIIFFVYQKALTRTFHNRFLTTK